MSMKQKFDVVIVGGGPAGLSAALMLGRGRKRVLLLDSGTPRNARAHEVHNFVTRDGIPPREFRRIAHEQLTTYPNVSRGDQWVERIEGEADDFTLHFRGGEAVQARRVLLALGMVDVLPDLPGYRELWGESIFQCPYCHGWEAQDQAFGYLSPDAEKAEFTRFLLGWTSDVMLFTDGRFELPGEVRERLVASGVRIEERPIKGLVAEGHHLAAVELADGTRIPRQVLFARPPQRQVALVDDLGLELDANGFVTVAFGGETSRKGVFAAGDMTTMMQGAVPAAAAGQLAANMINHALTMGAVHA